MESVWKAVEHRYELSGPIRRRAIFLIRFLGLKILGNTLGNGVNIKEFKLTNVY